MTRGKEVLEVEGKTVGECLRHFVILFPKMKDELVFSGTEESLATDGKLWSKIKVTVNKQGIDAEGLATRVKSGDTIEIETVGRP